MDHQQSFVREFDPHHLQSNSSRVISKPHDTWVAAIGSADRRHLLETKAAVLDDVARSLMGYPMLCS
jgi:hypothetical protein